jgi:hypothetical protein
MFPIVSRISNKRLMDMEVRESGYPEMKEEKRGCKAVQSRTIFDLA